MSKQKIIIAVSGASGAIYARQLLESLAKIKGQIEQAGVVFSDNAKKIWEHELGQKPKAPEIFVEYDKNDFFAPFASGSAGYDTMIVCPCSMGTLGRIASGISDCLATRAADVMLKERRKLILVTRETPLSLVHINNMKTLTRAGAVMCPACPSFYSRPSTMEDLAQTVVDRILDLAGFEIQTYRWQSGS